MVCRVGNILLVGSTVYKLRKYAKDSVPEGLESVRSTNRMAVCNVKSDLSCS